MSTIFSWNCRGSGGEATIPTLRRYLQCTGAELAFISETKCSKNKAIRRIAKLPLTNKEIVASKSRGGGLWLLWNDSISVKIVEVSEFFIIAVIQKDQSSAPWMFIGVYGDCADHQNNNIWARIEFHIANSGYPVCTIGDFNALLQIEEKKGGNRDFKRKNRNFRNFVQRAGLVDLGYAGPAYTWANNQKGKKLILERLDRGMATTGWIHLFPNTRVLHLPNFQSDHLPILLRTRRIEKKSRKPFRVEQWWLRDPDFKRICAKVVEEGNQSWDSTCSNLRKEVRGWTEGTKDPNKELKKIEEELEYLLNAQQNDEIRGQIAKLQAQHAKYLLAQETYWMQRSRQNWAVQGDSNTKFFHASTIIRRRRNSIAAVLKDNGEWAVEEKEVRKEFINYFKNVYLAGNSTEDQGPVDIPMFVRNEITPIPTEAWVSLDRRPTEDEIRRVVFELGPFKAPGPDGITAALVQHEWELFRPIIQGEVLRFFHTAKMDDSIARSNLILVPKISGPTKVSDYRPISVCNLIYKVISKLIARKMQPWIDFLISKSQTAFVPGREISENIILLREILHTFKSRRNGEGEFVLKADLAKAFDRVNWEYLFSLLPIYGFSPTICKWIRACVTSSRFTVLFDGKGDGFIKPKRGLRQGCAMSPYLFIISMDPLSRWLESGRKMGKIRGIKLARSANPLTNSMFADDLLLMGALTIREMEEYGSVLTEFCELSGMELNPTKSKVWFSNESRQHERDWFLHQFKVKLAEGNERYLGCPVKTNCDSDFDYIIEKFQNRLNSWKSNLLSQAGRLVLIKSVMESLSIYAMGTIIFPTRVIKKLNAIIRNFFWGSTEERKRMPYVAWDKIATPKGMGGLGLRSLKELNQALLMKNVWKVIAGQECLWVQIIEAKYFPRGSYWTSCRRGNCSKLWKQLLDLRETIGQHVAWSIGDGVSISAFSQPWFPQWEAFKAANGSQRKLKVQDLIDPITYNWDFQALQSLFGFSVALSVATNEVIRPNQPPAKDCLLFTYARDGKFSIKKAYQMLRGAQPIMGEKDFWDWLWGHKGLLPKFKLFIWKCCFKAIPVQAVLTRRMPHISPQCPICALEDETVSHALFACQFARAAWIASPLGIRSDELLGELPDIIKSVRRVIGDQQIPKFMSIVWAVWRSRNDLIYSGKQQSITVCREYWNRAMEFSEMRNLSTSSLVSGSRSERDYGHIRHEEEQLMHSGFSCFVDGSWDQDGKAGIGLLMMKDGVAISWESKPVQAINATHAEAQAILHGFRSLAQSIGEGGVVYSDSLELVQALSQGLPIIPDWRTSREIWDAWRIQREVPNTRIVFRSREDEFIQIAHGLANGGRIRGWESQSAGSIS